MPYDPILDLMSAPEHPDLYMLGTFARRVTIYSQQVRAINLVDAIHYYRRSLTDLNIAIIGGGAAGITAAARAVEHGANVTLFEQNEGVLSTQYGCSHRWLHPTIYDWPFVNIDREDPSSDARLEVMNWSATQADQFASNLADQWGALVGDNAAKIRAMIPAAVKFIAPTEQGYDIGYDVAGQAEQQRESFPLVILAVGFGLEPKGQSRNSYWEQDPLGQMMRRDETVLIAGYGDGALTDLMRVCLKEFEHEEVLAEIIRLIPDKELRKIKDIERDAKDAASLTKAYEALKIQGVQDFLDGRLALTRKVFLTGRGPNLFDPRASALNRFVLSQLLAKRAFIFVPIEEAENLDLVKRYDEAIAALERKAGVKFSNVVLRFGPDPAIARINSGPDGAEPLDKLAGIARLKDRWESLQPVDDPTLVRLWENFSPISPDIEHRCVIFQAPDTPDDGGLLATSIEAIQIVEKIFADSYPESPLLRIEPITVSVSECIRTQRSLIHTVRALCKAPIAIFVIGKEMGQKNLAGMMLLGIRAVVRRGLTVVIHEGEIVDWSSQPFNLKEVHVLPVEVGRASARDLASFIWDGLSALDTSAAGYRDLPVFEIVRRPRRRTPPTERGTTEAFVLCSFSNNYQWDRLQLLLRTIDVPNGGKIEAKRVVDYASPLLVGERLYELTRFAGLCIVDWTEWRANVFFELGVRLVTNPVPPICILKKEENNDLDDQRLELMNCFNVLRYKIGREGKDPEFSVRFSDEVRLGREATANPYYLAAQKHISLSQEFHNLDLLKHVDEILGPDVSRSGRLPLLYGGNSSLARQAWAGSIEALKAAQLLAQWKIERTDPNDPVLGHLSTTLREVNSRLAEMLDLNLDPKYQAYAEGIDDDD
jgi:FAD dependent oxidoreductase